MLAKIKITGVIEVKTGMHIGGSTQFSAIGAVDNPIVRDIVSNKSMIPGTSLKGKMRSLLARAHSKEKMINSHDDDAPEVRRLFGNTKDSKKPQRSRLIFSDMILANDAELRDRGVYSGTEVKFENTINRLTAVANPRQIERAVRGSKYELELIYDAEEMNEIVEDFKLIAEALQLLEYDYLGGSGTRGYGKVGFSDLKAETVVGDIPDNIVGECNQLLAIK